MYKRTCIFKINNSLKSDNYLNKLLYTNRHPLLLVELRASQKATWKWAPREILKDVTATYLHNTNKDSLRSPKLSAKNLTKLYSKKLNSEPQVGVLHTYK